MMDSFDYAQQKKSPELVAQQRAQAEEYAKTIPIREVDSIRLFAGNSTKAVEGVYTETRTWELVAIGAASARRAALKEVIAMLDSFADPEGKMYTLADAAALVRAMDNGGSL